MAGKKPRKVLLAITMLPSGATSMTPSRLVSSASTSRFSAERRSAFSRVMASRILSCITVMDLSRAPVSSLAARRNGGLQLALGDAVGDRGGGAQADARCGCAAAG